MEEEEGIVDGVMVVVVVGMEEEMEEEEVEKLVEMVVEMEVGMVEKRPAKEAWGCFPCSLLVAAGNKEEERKDNVRERKEVGLIYNEENNIIMMPLPSFLYIKELASTKCCVPIKWNPRLAK